MRRRLSTWAVCAAAGMVSCASEPTEKDPPAAAETPTATSVSAEARVTYTNPASRFRFDMPSKSIDVERRSFDPSTPPGKVKERLELRQAGRLLVRIDAWTNPRDLDPEAWIDAYASYLNKGGTRFEQRGIGPGKLPAVLADTPASCQAPNVVTAVFAVERHMVAVTCRDGEDAAARRAFETVLDSFAMEVAR